MEKEILKRYLEGTASSEEESLVFGWLTDPSKRYEILSWIESYWTEYRMETGPVPTFEEVFGEALKAEKKEGKVVALHRNRRIWMYAAAACVVFFATGLWIGNFLKAKPADNKWLLSKAQTGKGERTQLMLSDGSEVFLSPETELMIHQEVAANPVVYLEGEAYFKMKDTTRSLVIKTKELVTTAKGSRINISAFTKDSTVTVSVEEGNAKVVENNETTFPLIKLRKPKKDTTAPQTLPLAKIRPAKVSVMVNDQELMTFNKNNGNAELSVKKEESDDVLVFDNAGEKEIVAKLKKWFGVQTFFTEPLEDNETFSGDYNKNATLQEVLSGISIALKQDIRIHGTTVYLIKKK
ncbi:DUF4974 domain-containing protein [Chitinophaga sp. SYP-B3965]|uniref:FecR family protein n=1 Tax=Chitinophaga sp. SYP-B3965 TaxID=2663120 RepID=UPI001299B110|nr:DUF4974 domain-containing protein [Chitinophaga sp. SYP-B3965]